jgi:hypothetical protein
VANPGGKNIVAVKVDASEFEGWFYEARAFTVTSGWKKLRRSPSRRMGFLFGVISAKIIRRAA